MCRTQRRVVADLHEGESTSGGSRRDAQSQTQMALTNAMLLISGPQQFLVMPHPTSSETKKRRYEGTLEDGTSAVRSEVTEAQDQTKIKSFSVRKSPPVSKSSQVGCLFSLMC